MTKRHRDMTPGIEWNNLPAGIRGGLWMASAAGSFTIMTTLIREAATDVHPIEIAFFRALTNLLLMMPCHPHPRRRTEDEEKGVKSADDFLREIAQSAWRGERPVGLSQFSPS